MEFTKYIYLVFIAVAAIGTRLCRRYGPPAVAEGFLLAMSLLFYAAWDARYLTLLLGLGVLTYAGAAHILAVRAAGRRPTRGMVVAPVAGVVLVLAAFKYTGALADLANFMLPQDHRISVPRIILPLGISFFTFEYVSYLVDMYRGGAPLQPFRRFMLFPSLFPHMVAGPILRVKEFAPQLDKPHHVTFGDVVLGVDRILVGLVKKLVFANSLATFVDQGFAGGAQANAAVDNWALCVAFTLQIYFDFSAYTDIAIGSGRLLGFTFPENFNLPYHAKNPSEFWNRWHMTLSRWVRDYVFFPLLMKAGRGEVMRYVWLLVAMALIGLWHGAGIAFILWGLSAGVLMMAHRMLAERTARLPPKVQKPLGWIGRWGSLALLCSLGVLFRSPTIGQAGHMFKTMFLLKGLVPTYAINDYMFVVLAALFYAVMEPIFQRAVLRDPAKKSLSGVAFWTRPLWYAAAVQLIFMFDRSSVAFIYFQF